jgi:hypothetical protein
MPVAVAAERGCALVTDTALALSGSSSTVSSWIVMSTGPARPGDTVTLAIAFSV